GVDGLLRSLAKELRGGATGNGVVLREGVSVTAPSALGALRFFLSARSAFVDGQLLTVASDAGALPASWDAPLDGRVAVVTGAARGIGKAIAQTLARDGATVVAVDVPAAGEQLAAVANEIRGTALQLDVTADDAGARILAHALQRHGRLDVVVHNAGITRDKLLANMTPDKWESVLAVNIASQLRINEALLTSGDFADAPRIVSLASTSGIAGNRGQTNYAASKGGVMPAPHSIRATPQADGSVVFTWVNPEPAEGDRYLWAVRTATGEPTPQLADAPTVTVPAEQAPGGQVCIEVSIVRADRSSSAQPAQGCSA
ncbi:SDR family NAD(P)-dependent oxidoreductase, partial [Cellulomonas septica]|uniref:SDR family NAD(P)-dependent oxidoreductase n=1 Tax=Cellulomonas septica TaxID=285080 RepID=UPI001FE8DAA6